MHNPDKAYRAVMWFDNPETGNAIEFTSPFYRDPRYAKSFISRWRRKQSHFGKFVDGWIEVSTGWERWED